jgi:hypothetical protein
VHWSRHLLASIHGITGVRSLIGASAVTHNPHFLFFLSPNVEDRQLGAIIDWPPEPVLLVLDAFKPSLRQQLLQQASRHSPGAWVLLQHCDRQNDQELAELKRLHALKFVELPKKKHGPTSGKLLADGVLGCLSQWQHHTAVEDYPI